MVDHEAADAGGAGAVELDRRQIAGVGWQNIVAIAGRRRSDDIGRVDADCQRHRHQRRQCGGLRIDEFRHQQQDQRIGPRVLFHQHAQRGFYLRQVRAEHGFRHPGDAIHRHDGDHAGTEHLVFRDRRRVGAGNDDDQRPGHQHTHLDHQDHGERLATEAGPQVGKGSQHRHQGDSGEENPHGDPVAAR